MPISAVLETLDGVDQKFVDLYEAVEEGGKTQYHLQVENIERHKGVIPLQNAHERQKDDNVKIRARLKALEDEKSDLQKLINEMPAGADEAAQKDIEKRTAEKFQKTISELESQIKERDEQLQEIETKERNRAIDGEIFKALADAGVPEAIRLGAARHFQTENQVDFEDGKPLVNTIMGAQSVSDAVKVWTSKGGADYVKHGDNDLPSKGNEDGSNKLSSKSWDEAKDLKDKVAVVRDKIKAN